MLFERGSIEQSYFCRFLGLEQLMTHLYVSKWPSLQVKANSCERKHVYGKLLKWQQSFMLIKQQMRENLSLLLTKSLL